ncbi:MAG: hypothetical protein R3A44_26890 [Caldilineaceae bacterium]
MQPPTLAEIRARDFERGFLPTPDPLRRLPAPFAAWEAVASELSKLALSQHLRPTIAALPPFPIEALQSHAEYERAMTMLAYMASMYTFAPEQPVATRLPAALAVPWVPVARHLGRPPILSYATQALYNWRRIEPRGPIAVGNLTLNQNFLGGMDEEWFVTIHINIEAEAGRALSVLLPLQDAVTTRNMATIEDYLAQVADTLQTMHDLLSRMPERCDPHIYYHRVRPYMFGWKDNPLLPDGMIYEGVAEFGGRPQQFRGETGAQSSIIYAIDAALGIAHEFDAMRAYLLEMRDYMPVQDRAFIEALEHGPSLREFVKQERSNHPHLAVAYNHCVEKLHQFRQLHIEYAALYVLKPGQGSSQGAVGTGGTPFTVYLKKHIKETSEHLL